MIITTTKQLRPREKSDHYPTPKELIRATLDIVDLPEKLGLVIDPGAGEGVYGGCIRERYPDSYIVGVDIDPAFKKNPVYNSWMLWDFRYFATNSAIQPEHADLVIGNPPYGQVNGIKDRKLAEKIVRVSWQYIRQGGYIVFLLRLNFLAGQNRVKYFWSKYPLKEVYALNRRPSFTGNRKTDAHEYGIFVWQKGYTGPCYMKWLSWDYDNTEVSGHQT